MLPQIFREKQSRTNFKPSTDKLNNSKFFKALEDVLLPWYYDVLSSKNF